MYKKVWAMKNILVFAMILFAGVAVANPIGNDVKLFYDQNGNLYTGRQTTYHANGNIDADFNVSNGRIVGMAKFFYESGELMESGNYVDGLKEGVWIKQSKTGVTIAKASFKNGEKDGEWFIYDNSGKKLFEMHYTAGKRSGTWYQWDADGNLISTKTY
ncbi:MAG TPA: toxin-antitoxin system YwqK family antitoxin [Bacteroidetes bacterium]|nr:toxin-antitoxin system YwqK family antitoxin [Bacteroidota bacterium]